MRAEDITPENVTAFWTAVATVVPVIAIALVLEARIRARVWAKKKNFNGRTSRIVFSIILSVLGSSLVVTEYYSLVGLLTPHFEPFTVYYSIAVIVASASLVISQPISTIAGAAMVDVIANARWLRNVPWAHNRVQERRVAHMFDRARVEGLNARGRLLGHQLWYLQALVMAQTMAEEIKKQTGPMKDLAFINATLVEMKVEIDGMRASLRDHDRSLLEIKNIGVELRRERDEGFTPKQLARIRRRLGELGTHA